MIARRIFLKSSVLAAVSWAMGGIPTFLNCATTATRLLKPFERKRILVAIYQRGGMDGLMAVAPFNDPWLKKLRPRLNMSAARSVGDGALIDLDGTFGLHPALRAFSPLFKEGRLAIVHGIGIPTATRSHFDAQEYMETGTLKRKGTPSGWLNRACELPGDEATPLQAVAATSALPRSLHGDEPALAISDLHDFDMEVKEYRPHNGVEYPSTHLGNSLKQIAQFINAEVGLEVAFTESLGWDTHVQQGTVHGPFAQQARDLADSVAAFWQDVEPYHDDILLMTLTEFGRTVHENGSCGTDHGRASCAFVLGNRVDGGKVHGTVPVLVPEQLEDGRDLPVTTDFRSLFAEVAGAHLRLNNDRLLFPEWNGTRMKLVNS